MTVRRRSTVTGLFAALGAGALVAATLTIGVGTGLAAPATLTMQHDCTFPLIGKHRMVTKITTSDLPDSIGVGEATPRFDIAAVSTLPEEVTQGTRIVGGVSIEGTATAQATVNAPQGALPVSVPNDVPKTPIPESGELVVEASGAAPSLTFSQPGQAKINVGDFELEMIVRNAQGQSVELPGPKQWPCKVVSGQSGLLHTFTITGEGDGGEAGGEEAGEAGGEEAGGEETGETGGEEAGGEVGGEEAGEDAGGEDSGEAGEEAGGEAGAAAGGEDLGGAADGDAGGGADAAGSAAGGSAGSSTSGGLALTGASVLVPTGVGIALISAGALLLVRRRPTS